jgi:N-acetylglucosaminyldiphosphoundecaprenol N-acetyl-beta-D-mannosaminyltransferase
MTAISTGTRELCIFGMRLNNLTMPEAISEIEKLLAEDSAAAIAFVNADCVNIAANDSGYLQAINGMDRVFIDGIGMRVAGRLLGNPVRDNVNGTDLFPQLCRSMAYSGKRLYLYGAKPGTAQKAAEWAMKTYPGLCIAGTQDGYGDPKQMPRTVAAIRSSQPDVILVALGAPHQEKWIQQHRSDFGNCVLLGVGGLFDYYSGNIPRAPLWMRRTGLEWLFRLIQEPGRLWRRYLLGNASFLWRVFKERYVRSLPQIGSRPGVSP